jgi:hypothetical protein
MQQWLWQWPSSLIYLQIILWYNFYEDHVIARRHRMRCRSCHIKEGVDAEIKDVLYIFG